MLKKDHCNSHISLLPSVLKKYKNVITCFNHNINFTSQAINITKTKLNEMCCRQMARHCSAVNKIVQLMQKLIISTLFEICSIQIRKENVLKIWCWHWIMKKLCHLHNYLKLMDVCPHGVLFLPSVILLSFLVAEVKQNKICS